MLSSRLVAISQPYFSIAPEFLDLGGFEVLYYRPHTGARFNENIRMRVKHLPHFCANMLSSSCFGVQLHKSVDFPKFMITMVRQNTGNDA
jgi:hypothetical protein